MGVVYVKRDCVVAWSGGQSPLSYGDVWDDQAPLVVERPELFDTEPTLVRGRRARRPDVVDDRQAQTAATTTAEPAPAAPAAKRTTAARTKRKA